jgi:two-component system sensor histidine kinase VicK
MTVVGTFLISSVGSFHLDEFSNQMSTLFSTNYEFVSSLRQAANSPDALGDFQNLIRAFSGIMGIDGYNRNCYILDGSTGEYLTGLVAGEGAELNLTPNILTAIAGRPGYAKTITAPYIDVAVPIEGTGTSYIVYIRDNKQRSQELTTQLFVIIMEALLFGFIISVLLSFLLSKTITTPIEELIKSAGALSRGEFSGRIETNSTDEIGVLTQTFNEMADTLRQTLETVENERTKLETLFLHMTDGVLAFDRGGNITQFNPAAERLLGEDYSTGGYENVLGSVFSWEEALKLKPPEFYKAEQKKGNMVFTVYITPVGEGDRDIMAVVHDVTEQTKLENARREFVANVSHELRTPLTNVKSYSETLYENDDIEPWTQRSFLRVIMSETDRMTRIVSDLLTLSRFDYEGMSVDMRPHQLVKIIQRVYEVMYLEAAGRGHEMSLELDGSSPTVVCDKDRIEQVLVNVISNAIKYTPDNGHIQISACVKEGDVCIEVRDDGIGIPRESIPRLFERFYRVDKARSRAAGGSGLGLSIAKEIVDAHRGSIIVESELGKGTKITITLPTSTDREEI